MCHLFAFTARPTSTLERTSRKHALVRVDLHQKSSLLTRRRSFHQLEPLSSRGKVFACYLLANSNNNVRCVEMKFSDYSRNIPTLLYVFLIVNEPLVNVYGLTILPIPHHHAKKVKNVYDCKHTTEELNYYYLAFSDHFLMPHDFDLARKIPGMGISEVIIRMATKFLGPFSTTEGTWIFMVIKV